MRITYRRHAVKEYWTARWEGIPVDLPMENEGVYPLKYARMTVSNRDGRILEAGCGLGRLLRYYHGRGHDIVGIDYVESAIEKIRRIDPTVRAAVGDIRNLAFGDGAFAYVLAFGLYHNLEHGLDKAIRETYRVLKKGGSVCASFRADNVQTRISDWLADKRANYSNTAGGERAFHKMNLTQAECEGLFVRAGFEVDFVGPAENMPILYKFAWSRAADHRVFDENKARTEGYRLSWLGQSLQKILMGFFPGRFCNIYVVIAHKSA